MTDVGTDVFDVFNADAETDEVRGDTGFAQLLIGELAVGVARGMKNAGASVCDMGHDGYHLQTVHGANGVLAGAVGAVGDYGATAVGKIFLTHRLVFVLGQSGIVYPSHAFSISE